MAYFVPIKILNSAQSIFDLTGHNIVVCPRKHLSQFALTELRTTPGSDYGGTIPQPIR